MEELQWNQINMREAKDNLRHAIGVLNLLERCNNRDQERKKAWIKRANLFANIIKNGLGSNKVLQPTPERG